MKTKGLIRWGGIFAVLLLLPLRLWAVEPIVTQSIALTPGWNAVFLEVQPLSNVPSEVFQGLPEGASIWDWTGKHEPMQFIQDPSEPEITYPKWQAIFNGGDLAELTTLHGIQVHSPFLIDIPASSPPLTLNITGRPTLRHKEWIPDSFNLTGFSFVSAPPSFADFFAPSLAHQGQTIYRMNSRNGIWEILDNPASTPMRSGEAFWVYCQSGSDYQGPLTVAASGVDGLDFGTGISLLELKIENNSSVARSVNVAALASATAVPLAYREYDEVEGGMRSEPLSALPPLSLAAGATKTLVLSLQRADFSGEAASVLEVWDDLGSSVRVPVRAISNPTTSYPGLWLGSASLNKVSLFAEAGLGPEFLPGEAKPTPTELNLNLILHQDGSGQVRLLKQAIVMRQEATYNADGSLATNERQVVLTRDDLIPRYSGVSQRDGTDVGKRLSAVAFDYTPSSETSHADTALNCTGTISGVVECRIVLDRNHPSNPFYHRFHPDHDSLASDYATANDEAPEIRRTITLSFESVPQENPTSPPPGWGVSMLGGTYVEEVTGLSRGAIRTEGSFRLNLATDIETLNDGVQ
ncbi:MAG: hypothetical protein C0622_09855 [Desulfuromonas sp.]|nr:MAG: hypothetical protein C0622_09855 [Desulfuromonas sp.]